ncbi:MAG: tRNA (adenosine(37)-N6)-dimethylallyltransferase MiaA [Spirochaetaceae bacterium]|nr:MAG: tRNA (adenosine(37)-N6)-dimethylallyltransferase MiaA [Spirochaetaceae bacterium]
MLTDSKNRPPCIILTGPTASGKTAALQLLRDKVWLAGGLEIEVICADAFQAYIGMDIGTAKPDKTTLHEFNYHLVDILSPDQQYSVGTFVEQADALCRRIVAKGCLPVMEGGSMYYIQTFLTGLPKAPAASKEIRSQVDSMEAEHGYEWLQAELMRLDPAAAKAIPANDRYRIRRALEICLQSGQAASGFLSPPRVRDDIRPLVLGIERERQELYDRINIRVEEMFRKGLPDEVAALQQAGYDLNSPGLKAIGYREFFDERLGIMNDRAALLAEIQKNTRRYAKRQSTFMKRLPDLRMISPDDEHGLQLELQDFLSSETGA